MISHIIIIEVLESPSFHPDIIYSMSCLKGIVYHFTGGKAFQLGTDEGIAFARLNMLKVNYIVDVVIKFEAESFFNICCGSHKIGCLKKKNEGTPGCPRSNINIKLKPVGRAQI